MLTQERMNQFEYLLSDILRFAKLGLSVRDAGICAFFCTAEHYGNKEQTIRDMVTRSCGATASIFYDAIGALFSGDDIPFKNKYYSYIPRFLHKKMNEICNKFMSSNIVPPEESPEPYAQLIKKFSKSSPDGKRLILAALSSHMNFSRQ